MNAKKAKQLRKAAALAGATQYEKQAVKLRFYERPTADGQKSLEQCHIVQPIELRKGSPRQVYSMLKRLEKNVGLDKVFDGLMQDHLDEVQK
jgi:hypothetical protein